MTSSYRASVDTLGRQLRSLTRSGVSDEEFIQLWESLKGPQRAYMNYRLQYQTTARTSPPESATLDPLMSEVNQRRFDLLRKSPVHLKLSPQHDQLDSATLTLLKAVFASRQVSVRSGACSGDSLVVEVASRREESTFQGLTMLNLTPQLTLRRCDNDAPLSERDLPLIKGIQSSKMSAEQAYISNTGSLIKAMRSSGRGATHASEVPQIKALQEGVESLFISVLPL